MTVPDDGPSYLGEALQRRGATLNTVSLDKGESVPDVSPYDMLLVKGGGMNANQETQLLSAKADRLCGGGQTAAWKMMRLKAVVFTTMP